MTNNHHNIDAAPECCIRPGTADGCQNVSRCGVNPTNASVCSGASSITLQDMEQIKGALMGHSVNPVRAAVVVDESDNSAAKLLRNFRQK